MEGGRRSGGPSGYLVKSKSSKGCLTVRKKAGDGAGGVGSSGSHKAFGPKQVKKRHRTKFSDSGSSDEPLMHLRRRVSSVTVNVYNGSSGYEKGDAEDSVVSRKRSRELEIKQNEIGLIRRNGEDIMDRKRNKLGVFEFDEYEGNDEGMIRGRRQSDDDDEDGREGSEKRYFRSIVGRSGIQREHEMGSSTHAVADGRKKSYFERVSGSGQGVHGEKHIAESSMPWRDRYDSDEPIRVQGKNGVLKVMVNNKKKIGGSFHSYDSLEAADMKGLRSEDCVKKNALVRPAFYSDSKSSKKGNSFSRKEIRPTNVLKPLSCKNGKVSDRDSENSDTFSKLGPKNLKAHKSSKSPLPIRKSKDQDMNSDDSDMSLKPGHKTVDTCKPIKGATIRGEKTTSNQLPTARMGKEKIKRGTGTEKQKLRERIREMLLNSGWTIDYRPRRNRDYQDAVYINPSGTAYWSIVKAYDALQKQLNDDEDDVNSGGDGSPFTPLSDRVLSQLTRRTRKKIEKEMRKKQRDADESEKAREATTRRSFRTREDGESRDSSSQEQKLSSFIKKDFKLMKARMNRTGSVSESSKGQSLTHRVDESKPLSGSNSHHGRKSKKLGRCTLLIRNSNSGQKLESGGSVPYAGKRTLLSWLIDCGAVHLSQKVRYMNSRRTKVMLEGWVTHEGIHCGCCSKILTVSKFEIHAGSKLRQPFQHIYLDSGISLLDCQIEAWSRQESDESIGFHFVDTDGDDPNDDTCGLCGDGGDLICCDGCPSTFHQNCLDIKMLPPGDWHCPNCTCKFCGLVVGSSSQEDDSNVSMLPICSLCAKKYHKSCTQEMDTCPVDTNFSVPCFCGNRCRELFEQLRRYLGVKHELDAGVTWSLVHRVDEGLESYLGLPQRVECNSKLAVALSVMDECFLPIVDRRSGINLLRSVLYNCGSNFNRLSFSGFYAVILERGDEIISAASIRFHGTELAEMPFIGTRHMYRRQGMCRRLLQAIESALSSMKVEKLIIPAISDLTNTWTNVFGFTDLDESLKQKLKSMNMLVFPGIDMLQKQLVEQEIVERDKNPSTARQSCRGSNNGDVELACKTEEPMALDSDAQFPDFSLNDASVMTGPLDALHEIKARHADECADKLVESALDKKSPAISDTSHGAQQDNKSESDSTIESNCKSSIQDGTSSVDSLDRKSLCISDGNHDVHEKDVKPEASSLVKDNAESCILGDTVAVDSDEQHTDIPLDDSSVLHSHLDAPGDLQNPASIEGVPSADSKVEDQLPESTSDGKSAIISDISFDGGEEDELKPISPAKEDNLSSKTVDECNASPPNLSESASNDLRISVSGKENKPLDKLNKQGSNEKTLVKTDTGKDELDMESMPVSESPFEVIAQSCRGSTSGDAEPTNVDTCLEAITSTEQRAIENHAKQIDEVSSVSVTSGSNVNSSQSDSEQNEKHPDEVGIKINPTLE